MPLPLLSGLRTIPRRAQYRLMAIERYESRCTPALLIDVGTHNLLPNTPDQEIDIFIQSNDVNDPKIVLMNFNAEIGDPPHRGDPPFDPYPNVQGVDFSGGIWDGIDAVEHHPAEASTPYYAESWIALDPPFEQNSVTPNGQIATLIVDTTGFTSGVFPLKLTDVGGEFGASIETNVARFEFNAQTNTTTFPPVPIAITNGEIRITTATQPPTVDLNGSDAGTGSEGFFTQGDSAISIVGSSGNFAADISDADSTTLASITITITDDQDGASEILSVDTSGTSISANYDSGLNRLTLSGSASIANYEQVLRTLTYENTASPLTPAIRTVSVVANDGTNDSSPAIASVTAYDDSFPWHNAAEPANVDNNQAGVTINDALLIVADLRNNGTRQLPPTTPAGSFSFLDVDRNNRSTINDALVVVAELRNALSGGEGEASTASKSSGQSASDKSGSAAGDLLSEGEAERHVCDLALLSLLAEEHSVGLSMGSSSEIDPCSGLR